MEFINIKDFCKEWKEELRVKADAIAAPKYLGIIGHQDMPYVKGIIKDCMEVGIHTKLYDYDEDINFADYMEIVYCAERYNNYIILQTPPPPSINIDEFKKYIDPQQDIDNISGRATYFQNTSLGIIKYLDACGFKYEDASVVVLGRSETVGKPMAKMLLDRDCIVTVCHSKTKHLDKFINNAELIICAVGKEKFLNCYDLHDKIVIDVGINITEDGKVVGDCFNTEGKMVTPVPGGVGLLTRCALLEQILNN